MDLILLPATAASRAKLASATARLARETRMIELVSCLYALWWTVLLSLPVNLFSTNLAFLGLAHMAGQGFWGLGTGAVCAMQGMGWHTGNSYLRWGGCLLAVALWTFIAAGIARASPAWHGLPVNTGFGVYAICAVVNFYCAVVVLPRLLLTDGYAFWYRHRLRKVEIPAPRKSPQSVVRRR